MHLKLRQLAVHGDMKNAFSELARLPLFAPNSLVGIWANLWDNFPEEFLDEIPESQWKPVDLALCDPKFPHLKSAEFSDSSERPVKNPHAFFERVLPKQIWCTLKCLIPCEYPFDSSICGSNVVFYVVFE